MYQGTTPTIHFTIEEYALDDMTVYVTFQRLTSAGEKYGKPLTKIASYVDGNSFYVTLTQEETLSLKVGLCKVQARFIDKAGNAYATDIEVINVKEVLDERIIKYKEG